VAWPQAQGGQCTRIEPQPVEHWKLCSDELAGFCGCPVAALDSLRWPFLDVPVIHGPAVAVRPVLGSGGVDRPGQDPVGRGAVAWRDLDPREAEIGLWVFRRHGLHPEPLSCPVDQACLNSICWLLLCSNREAQRSGDSAAMPGIGLEVQRERAEWALVRG
jgi:hypothetical protein